ncbi:unnamed protein product [Adineta ricciae]|uniref:Uncharacterized protein n=1 Tax=Adineta ricciae TaxID=249248 RepID=A0A816G072_ADIRI|nr:unnamed protein product [Adineta ricciae]
MPPCIEVQFDTDNNAKVFLDEDSTIQLDVVLNEHDGFPLDRWWRIGNDSFWLTQFQYYPSVKKLGWVTVLPTTFFEYSTAVYEHNLMKGVAVRKRGEI